jgi:hypothetical protein
VVWSVDRIMSRSVAEFCRCFSAAVKLRSVKSIHCSGVVELHTHTHVSFTAVSRVSKFTHGFPG